MAFEYTQNGRDLISVLAKALGRETIIGHCDFRTMQVGDATIPENAIIFTSYAVHYVPQLDSGFLDFLAAFKPRAVVHFEPCYEYFSEDSLHGLMCRRYVELNDYNRNLATLIEARKRGGNASIRVRENVLGSNPFLPTSVIEWTHGRIPE